jgi:phage recombination protein Bet
MTGTSLIERMAERRHIDAATYYNTLKNTMMPSAITKEQVAAFLMVADRYGLDPFTKEIYAFPGKGGGINPVVSIDGWIHLVQSHPDSNGFSFTYGHDEEGRLRSATCTMFRKNHDQPVVVTEFLSECYRNTEPWNLMPARMLRHKAFKEAARYCFGFSGVIDEDEARDMKPIVVQEKIAQAQAIDDLDAFVAATTLQDSSAGVSSPSAADEQGGGGDEGLQQASVPADSSSAGSPAVAPPLSGVGSGETPTGPSGAPSSLPPDAARKALIESAMQLATRPGFEIDARLDMLDELRAEAGRLSGLSADLIKTVVETAAKVVRSELKPAAAKRYIESLP